MRGALDQRLRSAAGTAIVSCMIAVGGCGGANDAGSTTATASSADIPSVTAPTGTIAPKRQGPPLDAGASKSVPPDSAPATGARIRAVMAPFYACLQREGVRPAPLAGTALRGNQIRSARLVQKEIQARLACIQKLPPQFKTAGERYRRRFGG